MIASNPLSARRASTGDIEASTDSEKKRGSVKNVKQSLEIVKTRSLSLADLESYMSWVERQKVFPTPGKVEFDCTRAFLEKGTEKALNKFLSHFIDEYTVPKNANTAKPVVALWLDKLDPVLPKGNPIRGECTELVDELDQKFNISRRLKSASDYLFIDKLCHKRSGRAEEFLNTVLTEFAALHSVSKLDEALAKDPFASFEDALQKCFLHIFAKYNGSLSRGLQLQGEKLINAFLSQTPDLLKNMFDEARLELGYDDIPEFERLNPSLDDLIHIHAIEKTLAE